MDPAQDQYLPSTVLFVGGIKNQTRADLHDLFARWKPVSARVGKLHLYAFMGYGESEYHEHTCGATTISILQVTDPATGEHRGFGFVEFATVDIAASAQKAIHDSDIPGESTPIRVSFAKPDKEKEQRHRNTSRDQYPSLSGLRASESGSGTTRGQAGGHRRAGTAW